MLRDILQKSWSSQLTFGFIFTLQISIKHFPSLNLKFWCRPCIYIRLDYKLQFIFLTNITKCNNRNKSSFCLQSILFICSAETKTQTPTQPNFCLVGFFFNVVIVYIELLFEFGVTHITQGQSTRWQRTCCFPRSARNAADSV